MMTDNRKVCEKHPSRLVKALGMCGSCYDGHLKRTNPVYKRAAESKTTLWKEKNPEKWRVIRERRKAKEKNDPQIQRQKRNQQLKRTYGITVEQYESMLAAQNGVCAICFRGPTGVRPLHVDHCHRTGKVRGLLCHQCNWYLGTLDKDPETLVRLSVYACAGQPIKE